MMLKGTLLYVYTTVHTGRTVSKTADMTGVDGNGPDKADRPAAGWLGQLGNNVFGRLLNVSLHV